MKIRPLKKMDGYYLSDDGKVEIDKDTDGWNAFTTINNISDPMFYESYPTLISLVDALEKL